MPGSVVGVLCVRENGVSTGCQGKWCEYWDCSGSTGCQGEWCEYWECSVSAGWVSGRMV